VNGEGSYPLGVLDGSPPLDRSLDCRMKSARFFAMLCLGGVDVGGCLFASEVCSNDSDLLAPDAPDVDRPRDLSGGDPDLLVLIPAAILNSYSDGSGVETANSSSKTFGFVECLLESCSARESGAMAATAFSACFYPLFRDPALDGVVGVYGRGMGGSMTAMWRSKPSGCVF
jgi:hypothetical protein